MSLFIAWLVFPFLLGLLSLGSGLLVEKAAGARVPGVLLLPLGLALIVVLSQITTYWDATAELSTPLVVVVAASGFALSVARLERIRPDLWASAAALGVLGIYAAPVVLSGHATFAGYTLLGDTAIHFALIDRVMEHGRDLTGLEPSSYRAALDAYFDTAYPLGSHTALGAVRPLAGQDIAWVFQPYLASLAALTALALYAIVIPTVRVPAARAVVAFVAAQSALVLAYSLQGAVKELAAIWVLALLVALVPGVLSVEAGPRRLIPLAVGTSAAVAVLSLAVAPWLGPMLLATLAGVCWRRRLKQRFVTLKEWVSFAVVTAAISFPTLLSSGTFVRATKGVVTAPNEFGNLVGPLRKLQMFGIWPSGDYRFSPDPGNLKVAYVLIGVAAAAAVLGLLWALGVRAFAPLLYTAVSLIGWAYATRRGSPWADAKALAIVSPAVVLAALLGPVALLAWGRRVEALLLAAVISVGVLWSNALAYHDVDLAPRDRLEELKAVGDRIDGQGPSLYTEFEEFGKHFLRGADPTGWSEAWQSGSQHGRFGFSEDIDRLPLRYVLHFRTLVLRRSPSTSRPPVAYTRTFAGHYYEVWQRQPVPKEHVLVHIALGTGIQASGRPSCDALRRLAQHARRTRAEIAYVSRPLSADFVPALGTFPPAWHVDPEDPASLRPTGPGKVEGSVLVRSPGPQETWVQGSFGRGLEVNVDGKRVGDVRYELNPRGQYGYAGKTLLTQGRHVVSLERGGGDLHPGNGGGNRLLGPIVLSPEAAQRRRVRYAPPTRYRLLCGRDLDWVELVRT